jgi:hypothetical protein
MISSRRPLGAVAASVLTIWGVGFSSTTALSQAARISTPGPTGKDTAQIQQFLKSLPQIAPPVFDERQALILVSLPLACIDKPQTRSATREYLYEGTMRLMDGYDKNRAFYGCNDWHSAVNSTWTIVRVLKSFPNIAVASLMKEKLTAHLSKKNIDGEMEFFKDNRSFERPFGYAWLLKLYGELETLDNADAKQWAEAVRPLAKVLASRLVDYLKQLPYPMRVGVHANTSYSLYMMFAYASAEQDTMLKSAITDTAKRFYLNDSSCPADYEPSASDFLSLCLTEASLMSQVLDPTQFLRWHDSFMPPVYSPKFKPLTMSPRAGKKDIEALTESGMIGDTSHLVGMSFYRAEALAHIANALPKDDPRSEAYSRLAAFHAAEGLAALGDTGYAGSHWVATYAVDYFITAGLRHTDARPSTQD